MIRIGRNTFPRAINSPTTVAVATVQGHVIINSRGSKWLKAESGDLYAIPGGGLRTREELERVYKNPAVEVMA